MAGMASMKAARLCALIAGSFVFTGTPALAQAQLPPPADAPPPAGATLASLENSAAFVADAFPDVHFLNEASRMAIAHATNEKLRDLALRVAREETAVGISLMHWVHTSGHATTAEFPTLAVGFNPPRMLPSQASVLQRLSSLQGRDFDVLYVSVEKDGLRRLETVYQDFVQNGADPGLHAIAAQELPEVKQLIAALGGL
jgi:predicted outer membrane protein